MEGRKSFQVHRVVGTSDWPLKVLQGGGRVSGENDSLGGPERLDVTCTPSLDWESRTEDKEMLTFVGFHGLGQYHITPDGLWTRKSFLNGAYCARSQPTLLTLSEESALQL